MERLRESKPVPGSPEAILVEAIRASAYIEPTPGQQRLVLERVLDRQRARRFGAAMILRPIVVVGVLLVAGVTAAATFGHSWIARGLRTFGSAAPVTAMATEPAPHARRHGSDFAEPAALDPGEVEPAPVAAPASTPVATHAAQKLVRTRALRPEERTEDPSLVVDAIRALRTDHDAQRAATLLAEYLRTYPRGALSEEAVALSIEAAATGHSPSASAFAAQYLREYPHGRFRRTAEQALEQRQP